MRRLINNIILTFVFLTILTLLPSYSAGFTLDYSIGFNGRFKLNSWTPLSVLLENSGRIASGTLEVIVTSGSEYQGDVYRTVYRTDVDLPQKSARRYAFTIKVKSYTHELIIRLRQNGETLYSRSINLRSRFTDKNFALVADNYVVPDILAVMPARLYPANVRPKFLPETWYGYNSVKLIIMRPDTIRQLRTEQYLALTQWLENGGHLVVGSGLNYGSLGDKRLQDILPIQVAGHQQFTELKSLGKFCSRELTAAKPFLVLNARIDESEILAEENGTPIVARRHIGIGSIIFLSVDPHSPPFSRWEGRRIFWDKILSLQTGNDGPRNQLDDQQILDSMFAGLPIKFPGFGPVVAFVGAYLIVLLLLLKKLKPSGRSRWRYCLILLFVILVFTTIAYRGLYAPGLKQKIAYNSFCQLDISKPQAPAVARYFIGLYSLINSEYTLDFGPFSYPVSHILSRRSSAKVPDPYILQNKNGRQQIIGSIKRWQHNFYRLNLHMDPLLAGYARHEAHLVKLKVNSSLPGNLTDCLLYYRKRFVWVEDVPAGSSHTIKLNWARLKKMEGFNEQEMKSILRRFDGDGADAYLRNTQIKVTPELLFEVYNQFKSKPDSMVLVGWVSADLIRPEFNRIRPPGGGITMIKWEIPVEVVL